MTSKIKVDNIADQNDNNIINESGDVITVGAAGDTVAVAGNIVKSNALQASDGGNLVSQSGTTITLGASGDTVSLASGASQTGFGREGSVNWQTGSIKTSTFTAVSGEGYFVNTTSGGVEVDLPAGSAGAIVAINDYAQTAATNNITVDPNGSEKIEGATVNHLIQTNGVTVTLVYVDGTRGWKIVDTGDNSSLVPPTTFTAATGGTITTSGDYKIHTFTGPGTFCVSAVGNNPVNPAGGPNQASYFVVAGGGGAGIGGPGDGAGGGGGGGVREGRDIAPSYTASPLVAPAGLTLTASPFTITVGAGGNGSTGQYCGGNTGSPSTFSTITSSGGGGAGYTNASPNVGLPGGSGGGGAGGGSGGSTGGTGNTPPVSPPQGNNGGDASYANHPVNYYGGGGGGAGAAGQDASASANGDGGNGVTTQISGSPSNAGGGGGVGSVPGRSPNGGNSGGGSGGGGNGGSNPGQDGSTNTGGGGGGSSAGGTRGGNGGSGIIRIRYKFQ
jgi:hypothetical protein